MLGRLNIRHVSLIVIFICINNDEIIKEVGTSHKTLEKLLTI